MKNLKTLSIIAIVLIGLFATSCTPENLDNDQTEQQIDRYQKTTAKTDNKAFNNWRCSSAFNSYYTISILFL